MKQQTKHKRNPAPHTNGPWNRVDDSIIGSAGRVPRPSGWLNFESGFLNTGQIVGNLETLISLLQTAAGTLVELDRVMGVAMETLNTAWMNNDHAKPPPPELQKFLATRLVQMEDLVRRCRFHGRGLLDGQSSVVGTGDGSVFVRGGPQTRSSPPEGYEINITDAPTKACMVGGVSMHDNWLRAEQEIFLAEGERYVRYHPQMERTINEFVGDLQRAVRKAGLDLEVSLTRQRKLVVRHGQYGSQFKFKGSSRLTPLLSKRPGKLEWSHRGKDIQGTIHDEPAFGIGRLLIGYLDNPNTSELAVLWRGGPQSDDNIARCVVLQNGVQFQEREEQNSMACIVLPALYPHQVTRWMETRSGYHSLSEIRGSTWQELQDSLHMLYAVVSEIEDWKTRVKRWIKRYQDRAMIYLRRGVPMDEMAEGGEMGSLEAAQMADALKEMIRLNG